MNSTADISYKSHSKKIWKVFIILSLITALEVVLGFFKPEILTHNSFIMLSLLNWIFIILTILKAYFIMWSFMHLEGERKAFIWSVVGVLVFYISYLLILILIEGEYVFGIMRDSIFQWNF